MRLRAALCSALLVGFVKFSRNTQGQTWKRTERTQKAA